MREDEGKVPDDFPELRCVSRLYSQGGKCYQPYYRAKDVWKWFKKMGDTVESVNK